MKKVLITMLLILLGMTGCQKDEAPLRFGTMPTYSASIYAVGVEQGFFEEAGVKVNLTVFRSARDRDAAATAGQLDGFMTDIMGALQLNDKDFPFMMTSREVEAFGVMAHKDIDGATLQEATIGLSENTVVDYIADTYLTIGLNKVPIVAVPDRMGALLNQEIDLGIFPQPFIGIIMGKGGQTLFTTFDADFHPVVVVFDAEYLKEHKKQVEAFYEGYVATVAYMKSEPYETYKDALVTHGLATPETVDLYRLPVDVYGLHQVQEDDYEAIMSWMIQKELLNKEIPYDSVVKEP